MLLPYYPSSGTVINAVLVGLGFHYEEAVQSKQRPHRCWQFSVYKIFSIQMPGKLKCNKEKTFGISVAHWNVHIPSMIRDMQYKAFNGGRFTLITQQNPFIIIENCFLEELRTILEKKCRLFAWDWIRMD